MKKLFTLVAFAASTASVYAQDVYNAIVDGKLAPEFAAVAGENGGTANNSADGKSIITMTAGKATVTAVGGTTPANNEAVGGAAQMITPGAPIEGLENTYEVASVEGWNDITWGLKNQGDIDFWYVIGTGNPYVGMRCMQNSKDGVLVEGSYKADYIFYEPDGSLGMPITGLYYKFTATAQGAFKVKIWANKGNRKTFVVNAATMKAERLYASGFINGVNDESGKKKLLSVEEVDAEHHKYIWGTYDALVEKGKGETQSQEDYDAKLAEAKENAEAMEIEREFVIGNGNQNFWGWLTFDVEPGEEYWVFQHSSQIGFGGFEFHEGITAEELISGIEAPYVYTTNFSTYEDEESGERVTWKGEKAVGEGAFESTEEEGEPFGDFFMNYMSDDWRTSYCLLPEDVLAHSAKTQALSFGVWMKAPADIASADYASAPILCAYDQFKNINEAPLFALQYNGTAKLDNGTQCDYSDEMNAAGSNAILSGENDWLVDHKWHYYTAVFNGETAQVFIDGTLKNEWNCGSAQQGLFENGENLKYVCLGGNQIDEMEDGYDSPFAFAHLLIKNSSMTPGEIKAQMLADFPDHEAYWESGDQPVPPAVKGDVNGDGSVDVADISAVISVMAGTSEYEAADVNEDGTVDVADISSIISIMAGGE
ncbi:MAG: dockerin type I repeat-containing protein [Prevotella sp.]|nr:dockerin type I repeat-containing protein [Prevotella sp.]